MVEGARLERYTPQGIEGSNPFLSAITKTLSINFFIKDLLII